MEFSPEPNHEIVKLAKQTLQALAQQKYKTSYCTLYSICSIQAEPSLLRFESPNTVYLSLRNRAN